MKPAPRRPRAGVGARGRGVLLRRRRRQPARPAGALCTMVQIPTVPLKLILLFHLFFFSTAMWVSPLSPSWLWTNLLVLLLLLRLLETPVTAAEPLAQVAEVSVFLYLLTVVNDIICFSISPSGLTAGQQFSLTLACFSMAAKPFIVPSLLLDMKNRGGSLGALTHGLSGSSSGQGDAYVSIPQASAVESDVYGAGSVGAGNTMV